MMHVTFRHNSRRRRRYRTDVLERLIQRVCADEGFVQDAELTVTFCDDPFIAELNRKYLKKNCPTDVLSFAYELPARPKGGDAAESAHPVLGDIIISLETAEKQCGSGPAAMPSEVRRLLCHAVLHLLGFDHDTEAARRRMAAKQALYLGLSVESAWQHPPATARSRK